LKFLALAPVPIPGISDFLDKDCCLPGERFSNMKS
jgi:hypothetical protein